MKPDSPTFIKYGLPVLLGAGLLPIPLLGDFHIESAILVSLVGCFWAGIKACEPFGRGDLFEALHILWYLFLVGVPLLLYAVFTDCFTLHGLAFWLLFPLPSVFFGYSLGRMFRKWHWPYRRILTTVLLLGVGIGILAFEFFTYPQVYFFNHVWGGWPGPIYDENVTVEAATLFFRIMTLLWALLLWHIPSINKEKVSLWIVALSTVALGFCYTQLAEVGVISSNSYLQSVLGGSRETDHFKLYYDQEAYSDYEIDLLAREHEFYLDQIADTLQLQKPDSLHKIESYLYANPWQKKRLVGAKYTSYVPIWLDRDQLHIAKQQIDGSLKHELVHITAKQFGNFLFNGSWSIGLIEGIAVALDGGSSKTTTIDQLVVAEKPYPTPVELQQSFSLAGFYGGRSGVNYTTSGSFVRYLLRDYPVEYLKKAYRTGSIQKAYPQRWTTLTKGWYQHLDAVSVDSVDQRTARRIFAIPSLFEQPCPHVISDFATARDNYRHYWTTQDTTRALQALDKALVAADSLPPVKAEWAFRHLLAHRSATVRRLASPQDTTVDLQLLYADAYAIAEQKIQKQRYLSKAESLFAQHPDTLKEAALQTRRDARQWKIYLQLVYHNILPDLPVFQQALYRTKMLSVRAALEKERWSEFIIYARELLRLPLREQYASTYRQLMHHLLFREKWKLANQWITKIWQHRQWRERDRERLQQEKAWRSFLRQKTAPQDLR